MYRVALVIRPLRLDRGLTVRELAARADVRPGTVVNMEKNRVRRINLDILSRLAAALDSHPHELLSCLPDP